MMKNNYCFVCAGSIIFSKFTWESPITSPNPGRTGNWNSLPSGPEIVIMTQAWPISIFITLVTHWFWDRHKNHVGSVIANVQVLLEILEADFFLKGLIGSCHHIQGLFESEVSTKAKWCQEIERVREQASNNIIIGI